MTSIILGALISVSMIWDPSPSEHVDFYRIYRAEQSAGPYTLVGDNLVCCTFTDEVGGGTIYYWVATAVGTNGMESENSNEVNLATMPAAPRSLRFGQLLAKSPVNVRRPPRP